jgi:SAM-dependent methyltransferase
MQEVNAAQAEYWNAEAGQGWVTYQADMDLLLEGVTARLVAACAPAEGTRVLDIGCGAGGSSLALAESVGPRGRVLGLDISEPLLARAEARRRKRGLDGLRFEVGDAQTYAFAPGGFDLAASRFGMMFFADPAAAFRNIATGIRHGGRLVFAAWAGPEHNPWFSIPQRIIAQQFGPSPEPPPDAPGPMAFRDAERVLGLMRAAGLASPAAEPVAVDLHHPGGLDAGLRLLGGIGPVVRALGTRPVTSEARADLFEALGVALRPMVAADGVRVPARIMLYSAEVR